VIVFGEMWKGSLSSFKYFSFSFMPKTMKDYGDAKHSNIAVTPTERNAVSIEAFNIEENAKLPALSLSDYPAEIQSVLSFLVANKTPVTLVFNITNNNMQIGDSQASNICLITGHDNSSISGRENTISKI
jgi:hypothetical protein